jgi:hypothetical protein
MSGYLVPEVWCDGCDDRVVSDTDCSLREHRSYLRGQGWRRVERTVGARRRLVDLCPSCDQPERLTAPGSPVEPETPPPAAPTAAEWAATGGRSYPAGHWRVSWKGESFAFDGLLGFKDDRWVVLFIRGEKDRYFPSAREAWEFVVACQVATWRWRCESCGMEFDRQPSFPDGTPRNWHVAPDGYGSCGDVVLAAPAVSPPAEPVSTPEVTEATDDR